MSPSFLVPRFLPDKRNEKGDADEDGFEGKSKNAMTLLHSIKYKHIVLKFFS